MTFYEVKISTTTEGVEIVTGALAIQGLSNFVIEDAADFNEFLETNTPRWDYIDESLLSLKEEETCVKLYLAENAQGEEQLALIKSVVAGIRERDEDGLFGSLEITLGETREEDWENNWKEYFKPFKVGDKFYIKPSWETIEDDDGRIILEIDPASSFGTGTHATTQLCIEALEGLVKDGSSFCDLGCGSGILTLAAHLLGAKRLSALDIDENAVRITSENLARNNASAALFTGDITSDTELREGLGIENYDVVAANIVADVLKAAMKDIYSLVRPGGHAVLSGIIGERKDEVCDSALEAGFTILNTHEKDDWAAVVCVKQKQRRRA